MTFVRKTFFQPIEFVTRKSGVLTAERRTADLGNVFVEMRLPVNPASIRITSETHADVWKLVKTILVRPFLNLPNHEGVGGQKHFKLSK